MKILNTATGCWTSEVVLREQHQICRKRSFSSPGLVTGLTVFTLIALAVIIVPAAANVNPNEMAIADRLKGSSLNHPSGADESGRDLMIRALHGARVSFLVDGAVALLSYALGTVTGIYASYLRILDHILIRICEDLIAISGVLLATALMAALGTSDLNVTIALTIVYTLSIVRIMRNSVLVTRSLPYVGAAKVQGAGNGRILWGLTLPSVISLLTVQASFIFAQATISEVLLGFLGVGTPAPATSWGSILQGSEQVLQKTPRTVLFPGLAVVLCVLSLNLLGDGLRDYPDPRTAGRKKRQ